MRSKDKNAKSSHLQKLEEVFDRRARRFSPFSILGLSQSDGKEISSDDVKEETNKQKLETPSRPTPPMGGLNTSIYRLDPPMGGVGEPMGGVGRPTIVVEVLNTTTTKKTHPWVGRPSPPMGGSQMHLVKKEEFNQAAEKAEVDENPIEVTPFEDRLSNTFPIPEKVVATQIGTQLSQKAKAVLRYLNSIRSLESESYSVPVGYSQISSAAQVDGDYLRRKVLPKLAMLGLLGVARKSLNGTVYYLPYPSDYINTVTSIGEGHSSALSTVPLRNPGEAADEVVDPGGAAVSYPEWLDKEAWGWLSQESLQRLIDRAGSEAKAKEKLDIILYNESHGAPEKRVRNRRSVLAHYLSSANADIWPNDTGFETLEMQQLRQDRDRAKEIKALAEEVLRERHEAAKAQFLSSLTDAQLRWLKQEAKRKVDTRPEAKLVTSRYPLYKAEEENLTCEWIDRVAYGESVPEVNTQCLHQEKS